MGSSCTSSSGFGEHVRYLDTVNHFRGDLQDLQARGLTANPGRTLPAKDLEDTEVRSHQQLYCRFVSQQTNIRIHSWRPGSDSCQSSSPHMPTQAEPPPQTSAGPCSPFQALSQSHYVGDRTSSPSEPVPQHASLAPLPDFCTSLEDIDASGLTDPVASSLSCSTPGPSSAMSTIDRYPSAPALPAQDLFPALASAATTASDPLSTSSPIISPMHTSPAAPTEADHVGSMVMSPHMEVTMSLTAAPADFSHPTSLKKAFSPAFRASVSISSESHNTWCVRMTAYLLTAAQVSNLHTWDPKQHSMLDSIIGHTVEKPVVCNGFRQDEPDGPKMYQGNCRLTFQDLKFASSSGMQPRWLVFAMMLPNEDIMFVHYTVPTVVMSRRCGQTEKAAAILSGQIVTKKKRARSSAQHEGGTLQGSLQNAPQTPGLATESELLPPECTAQQLQGQLLQPAQFPGITHQPAYIPGMTNQPPETPTIMPQGVVPHAMYQSPTHSHHQHSPSQLNPINFAQPPLSHAGPALSHAEEACLLRLGTQPMSYQSTVSSEQVSNQLPRKLATQLPESRDPRSFSPAQLSMSQLSPASSRQLPAQPPTKLPVPSPATSRDPRRPSYCGSTVAATLSDPEKGLSPMEGLSYSPHLAQEPERYSQHLAQEPERRPPSSPFQSALFATIQMLDSPDVTSSAVNAGDALTQASSPGGRSSPETNAMIRVSQRQLSDSLPLLDALLSDNCGEADFALVNGDSDFNLGREESDYAMCSEATQMAGQHAEHDMTTPPQVLPVTATCHDMVPSQTDIPRAPSSSLSSQTFSPAQAVAVSRLQKQFHASRSSGSCPAAKHSDSTGKPLRRRWPESPPYTICRWHLHVMQLYENCDFSRELTPQDMSALCQMAGFCDHPELGDTEVLCSQHWLDFGKWFISQLQLLQHQQQYWDQGSPTIISSFEVDQDWCEDLLKGHMPGAFLIWHGMSQTACLIISLVDGTGSIKHLRLDRQQLAAHPLQAWVMHESAAKVLVDSKTGQTWKKEQMFLQPPPVDGPSIAQTNRQAALVSALLASSSCAASVNDSGGPQTNLHKGLDASCAASPSKHAVPDSPQRKRWQQHSARRIVTSLSSVTERHLNKAYPV